MLNFFHNYASIPYKASKKIEIYENFFNMTIYVRNELKMLYYPKSFHLKSVLGQRSLLSPPLFSILRDHKKGKEVQFT